MAGLQDRVVGAAQLRSSVYEEVRLDAAATAQAASVVVLAGVARGIGSFFSAGVTGLVTMTLLALIGWVVWSAAVWLVGTKLIPGRHVQADLGQVARPVGFAQAPGIGAVLGIIPLLGWLIGFVVGVWVLVASVMAVKQALGYDDVLKTVLVCIIAAIPAIIVMVIITIPLGIGLWLTGGM